MTTAETAEEDSEEYEQGRIGRDGEHELQPGGLLVSCDIPSRTLDINSAVRCGPVDARRNAVRSSCNRINLEMRVEAVS